ncbi:MAG TPA: hypothetical protein DCR93_23035 [Cytophagales bacterium]|nr:hypothetical protein [Cytophagales bacterium]HAP62249.1 hypothetical protein [Cytophagales bacterium]
MMLSLVFTFSASAVFTSQGETNQVSVEITQSTCPDNSVTYTFTGCALERADGCWWLRTSSQRFLVHLFNYPNVQNKDEITVTGRFATDLDCGPCVFVPTSLTITGQC